MANMFKHKIGDIVYDSIGKSIGVIIKIEANIEKKNVLNKYVIRWCHEVTEKHSPAMVQLFKNDFDAFCIPR